MTAALGAVAALNHRRPMLDPEALRAAVGRLAGDDRASLERALDTAVALAAPAAAGGPST